MSEQLYSEDFQMFWSLYPRKRGKKAAYKAWKNATDRPPLQQILAVLAQAKTSKQWQSEEYIPHPSTWINQGRWDDEWEPTSPPPLLQVTRPTRVVL